MRMQNSKENEKKRGTMKESCLRRTIRLLFSQNEGILVTKQQEVVIFFKRAVK